MDPAFSLERSQRRDQLTDRRQVDDRLSYTSILHVLAESSQESDHVQKIALDPTSTTHKTEGTPTTTTTTMAGVSRRHYLLQCERRQIGRHYPFNFNS